MTEYSLLARLSTAVFYGLTSVLIVVTNKLLLTNFRFPSYNAVALGQMIATLVILRTAKLLNIIKFPSLDGSIARKIFPLPLLYGINLVSGLGGTQLINLAMFTVLRRFSILITMVLEFYVLGVVASRAVRLSVGLMILGSIVAALYDLSFDAWGYTLVTINNICTAALGVYTKQKLDSKDLGKYGLMYYNCLFIVAPFALFCSYTGDIDMALEFMYGDEMTTNVWICFVTTCVCGFILNYALILCTQCNSALTTQCVGPIKNLLVTYIGMFSSGDFVFQWLNFAGINISVLGSILYAYVTFRLHPTSQSASVSPCKSPPKQSIV